MRPLKLIMQAFGPYAGTETIDFTMLGNRTMFVISGKTGSGKTTIFDGISYAIYGKASGEDRNGPELRSQFARNELLTEVTLKFSLRNKTFIITRSPQQEKKKERGDGMTTISAKAELYMINSDGDKQLLASNIRDVDEKIKEIMIIDSNQFRQILMIPQGEFRKLLTSESKDKEVILQRLFHTQIYKRIEEKLKEDAIDLKKSVEKQVENRDQAIQQISALFNEELKGYLNAGSVNDTLIMPLLQLEMESMTGELGKLADQLKDKQEKRDLLQQKLFEAETIVKQLKAKDELEKRKTELHNEKDVYSQIEKKINLAQKAAVLAQQEELCHHLKKESDEANNELQSLNSKITSLSALLYEQEKKWEEEKGREDERRALAEEISSLKNMKEEIESLSFVKNEVTLLEKALEKSKIEKLELEDSLKKSEQAILLLQEEKQQIEREQLTFLQNAQQLEKLEEELLRFNKYEELILRYDQAKLNFEKRKGHHDHYVSRLADVKETIEQLEQKWLHGQASLLANKLHVGEACPVCGSREHPNIAAMSDSIPDEKDLKAAKKQADELEKEKAKAESSFYESQSIVNSIKESLESQLKEIKNQRDDLTINSLPMVKETILAERDDLVQKQSVLSKRQAKMPACLNELKLLEQDREKFSKKLKLNMEQINNETIIFTEKKTHLTRMIAKIPPDLHSAEVFESRLKNAIKKQEDLIKLLETVQQQYQDTKGRFLGESAKFETIKKQADRLKERLTMEREAFVQKMNDQGFGTYSEYNESKKSEQEIQLLDQSLRDYREELRSVHDRYEELTMLLKDVEMPDLEQISESFKENEEHIRLLQEQYTDLFMKKKHNEETAEKIIEINKRMKALEDRYKLIGHLYEIAKGQNTYRITFERFVLAAFLDDILREANGRLRKMTSGRYELLRKTDRSKGNVQSGLELLVFDQYTGQERHVKTLSGGESFKAALALALGLADVVQQYAGGVSLETMFIDEGFGTLDPESLDQAIEALMDIQSSGRLVGIISHVPELKERIDARLEVIATQTGSQTEFQFLS
ncbi:SMC family ATPase [Bacillus sp. DTU_2020_1000418_1_SI_GHA_SEK_038]|uniref:SMC family ATPase n=1 Tax=Bacillus sp. DTU_2020_1000418_1_SI_GHA_SEK_038 TaxID=3077585 RepID=UPI0028ECB218|nr:SMC family ATPase [Bacillus sp. DTU_2020_1000418_1_SI_GHA_SEK_038]WNS77284.1 SMC family ATPase [Bacillus sp. DTU_2020_1000418_1_SI_GHA_SEK_038]